MKITMTHTGDPGVKYDHIRKNVLSNYKKIRISGNPGKVEFMTDYSGGRVIYQFNLENKVTITKLPKPRTLEITVSPA